METEIGGGGMRRWMQYKGGGIMGAGYGDSIGGGGGMGGS